MVQKSFRKKSTLRSQCGAAALEYVLVSTFAAVVTVAALSFLGQVVKEQLDQMADRMGVESVTDDFDFFGDR